MVSWALIALAVAATAGQARARASTLTVQSDDRSAFLVEPFCFGQGGSMNIQISDFRMTRDGKRLTPSNVGLLIRKTEGPAYSVSSMMEVNEAGCLLNTKKPNDVIIPIAGPNTTYSHQIAANGKGLYSILYSNCNYGSKASFQIHYVLMNKDGIFISEGEVPLPLVYAGASLLFLFAFVYWVYLLRTSSSPIHKIQYLMGLLCFFKAASVGFEAFRYQSLKSFGDGYAWATLFHILTFVKGTMLFAVILLIGTGWSIMKPFLADREKRIILIVLPMQVLVNVAMVVVDETPPGTAGWMTWRDILHFFDGEQLNTCRNVYNCLKNEQWSAVVLSYFP